MQQSQERIDAIEHRLDVEAEEYMRRTSSSLQQLRRNARYLPLGVASSFQSHYPYPFVIERGEGPHVWDLDGNRYLDLHAGFGCNIYGHAHPAIVEAVRAQAGRGLHFAAPTPDLERYVQTLCERLGMEQVRLCNSGTEATMDALRLARAYTGRDRILKVEGCYHGHHDQVMVSVSPPLDQAGESQAPRPVPNSEGLSPGLVGEISIVSFNDLEALEQRLREEDVAAFILEPVLCNLGMTMPVPGYLEGVRALCDRYGTVLIFDQVKTGLTISYGGAVETFGVQPDLQCFGKAIGGGAPVGAFGGKAELMELIRDWRTPHFGTFSGNPLVVAAGLAALERVLTPQAYRRIGELSQRLIDGIQSLIDRHRLPFHCLELGAKGGVFFSPQRPRNYRDWAEHTDRRLAQLYWLYLANRGIWVAPGADEQWTLPCVMSDEDADHYLEVFSGFAELVARLPD